MNNKNYKKLKKEIDSALEDSESNHGLKRALRRTRKELKKFKNHQKGKKELTRNKDQLNPNKIQIGGGKHTLKDFLNIDIQQPADLIYDVREGIPLSDGVSKFIFTEHFLEHIDYPESAKKFTKECLRVLEDGGKLVVGVPDSELVIEAYYKDDKEFYNKMINRWYSNRDCLDHFNTYIDLVNYHFRDQDDSEDYAPHLWGYDFEKLESMLESAGFSEVEKWDFDSSIAKEKRKWGSIYVEAKK